MLLLDHNLPHQLREFLTEYGFKVETTQFRGWESHRNGDLVSASFSAGFRTIITRDKKFAESASRSLVKFPEMSIVIVRLNQRSWKLYETVFREEWSKAPFIPQAGKVIVWPSI